MLCTVTHQGQVLPSETVVATASLAALSTLRVTSRVSRSISQLAASTCGAGESKVSEGASTPNSRSTCS